jgi:hypothetical protein
MEESPGKDNRMDVEEKISGGGVPPTEQLGARTQQILAQEREKRSRTLSSASAASVGVDSNFHGDSTYSAILNDERMSHFNTKNLNGGVEVACQHNVGNFYSAQDLRLNKACFKTFFNKKQNVSFSFNPDTLECNSCSNTHSISTATVRYSFFQTSVSRWCFRRRAKAVALTLSA